MKKLIPALAMLLVAACLMGTSTYAWFSANTQVTASGMSVKAAADGGIGIASWTSTDGKAVEPAATAFKTTDSAAWSNQLDITNPTVKPTSCDDGIFYTGTAAASNAFTATGTFSKLADASADAKQVNAGYYNHTKWSIMSLNASADTTLKVASITVTKTGSNTTALNKALRVAIKTTTNGSTTWKYFAPLADNGTTFTNVTGAELSATESQAVVIGDGTGTTLGTLVKTTPAIVEVFVYYDGQDANCKTENLATSVDDLAITIVYTNA